MFFYQENIPVRFLGAYNLYRDKGYIHTARKSYYSLSIRVEGEAEFTIDKQTLSAKRGEIVLIPPNIIYSQYTEGEQILAVHFDSLEHFNIDTILKQTVKDWDSVFSLFPQIYSASSTDAISPQRYKKNWTYARFACPIIQKKWCENNLAPFDLAYY